MNEVINAKDLNTKDAPCSGSKGKKLKLTLGQNVQLEIFASDYQVIVCFNLV